MLLNNSVSPTVSVAAITKHKLKNGSVIDKGIGSFEVRGVAVRKNEFPNHVPIGLLSNAVLRRTVEEGEFIVFQDVDIPDSLALRIWQNELKEKTAPQDTLHPNFRSQAALPEDSLL